MLLSVRMPQSWLQEVRMGPSVYGISPAATHSAAPLLAIRLPYRSVAFSPDGQTLASGGADYSLVLWDVFSPQPVGLPLTGFWGDLSGVTFIPDGQAIAFIRGENTLTLRDIATGRLITSYGREVFGATLNRAGDTLAFGHRDGTVLLWNVANHQPLAPPLNGHESFVVSVAFSLDGQTLASGMCTVRSSCGMLPAVSCAKKYLKAMPGQYPYWALARTAKPWRLSLGMKISATKSSFYGTLLLPNRSLGLSSYASSSKTRNGPRLCQNCLQSRRQNAGHGS